MKTLEPWKKLALLHECGHAWLVGTLVGRPVTILIPSPASGDDARCEWDALGVDLAQAVVATLGGMAAELLAGVPDDVARRNADEDLATLADLGLGADAVIDEALSLAMDLLEDDAAAFSAFYRDLRDLLASTGLPFEWRGQPG